MVNNNNFEGNEVQTKTNPFSRESVERAPQRAYAYDSNYYGFDPKQGRNLAYYGRNCTILYFHPNSLCFLRNTLPKIIVLYTII